MVGAFLELRLQGAASSRHTLRDDTTKLANQRDKSANQGKNIWCVELLFIRSNCARGVVQKLQDATGIAHSLIDKIIPVEGRNVDVRI